MSPTAGVLALQGDVREHLQALTKLGVRTVAVRRTSELASVDALVIPGGESTTMAKLLHLFDLADPIRARIASDMPVLGSCAGMIMLSDRVVGWSGGRGHRGPADAWWTRRHRSAQCLWAAGGLLRGGSVRSRAARLFRHVRPAADSLTPARKIVTVVVGRHNIVDYVVGVGSERHSVRVAIVELAVQLSH